MEPGTHPHWPLWDLWVRTPRLELRPVREAEMADLVGVIDAGLHDPATMPFALPFTDEEPVRRARDSYRFWFSTWANWSPEAWHLVLVAYETAPDDGGPARCVGCQSLRADAFARLGVVGSGSFLGLEHQGRGLGREMRAAVLTLAFDGLGARRAETEAYDDNVASIRVTEWAGYRPNGDGIVARRDASARVAKFALDRADWDARRAADPPVPVVTFDGLSPAALEMFGATLP
ncbi:MAG: GNAT family N-acetyltransferase [Microthrixaceae bacterium]